MPPLNIQPVPADSSAIAGTLNTAIAGIWGKHANDLPIVAGQFPLSEYKEFLKRTQAYLGVARNQLFAGLRNRRVIRQALTRVDEAQIRRFNKLVLLRLMSESLAELPRRDLPETTLSWIYQWFDRVLRDSETQPDSYYDLTHWSYRIDLGVCCLESIPVGGAWTVQKSRIGLGPLLGGGPLQLPAYLWFCLGRAGGATPYYVLHTAPRYLPMFRAEQMALAYLRIAELMQRDHSIRGLYRGGWLLDPALETVSPHLAFVRTVPTQNGAQLFRSITLKADVDWALTLSSHRRKLFEEGRYRPRAHAYVWPRAALLKWAAEQTASRDARKPGQHNIDNHRG